MPDVRLGRLYSPDERDQRFPMRSAIRRAPLPDVKIWTPGPVLDQGETPMCVGHAWQGWRLAAPMVEKPADQAIPDSVGGAIYIRANAIDEWAPQPHDGTSVRAGARILADPQGFMAREGLPVVTKYLWAQHWTDIRDYVLLNGPVVMGTTWYAAMFTPTDGWLRTRGSPEGGHAWLIHGFNKNAMGTGYAGFLMRNSWGESWGMNGGAWISPQDVDRLLRDQGEACTAVGDPNVDPTSAVPTTTA